MFRGYKEKKAMRIKGQVVNIIPDTTYDMGGRPMSYYIYIVQLETGNQVRLCDKISNSYVEYLGLKMGDIVTVNGLGKLVK